MGARPIALLNSIHFGSPSHPKTKSLLNGVVSGIGGYGNCIGVPTIAGQTSFELHEVLSRNLTPDGQSMLIKFHQGGMMQKVPTDTVIMTPTTTDSVQLDELNKIIAEQRGVSIDDLAVQPKTATPVASSQTARNTPSQPLSDEQLAGQMRSNADRFYKEAARLRKEAEALSPTKKSK